MKKKLRVTVEGKAYEVEVEEIESSQEKPHDNQQPRVEKKPNLSTVPSQKKERKEPIATKTDGDVISAPIPGKVLTLNVKVGQKVSSGDVLLILEAMKMENEISATTDGEVKDILVNEGDTVQTGDKLVVIG